STGELSITDTSLRKDSPKRRIGNVGAHTTTSVQRLYPGKPITRPGHLAYPTLRMVTYRSRAKPPAGLPLNGRCISPPDCHYQQGHVVPLPGTRRQAEMLATSPGDQANCAVL